MKMRSIYFLISGALGGLAGFGLMELLSVFLPVEGSRGADLLQMAVYFSGFGLAVGGALGMTEGVLKKSRRLLRYGLLTGLVLGAVGGFVGGFVGQGISSLFPLRYAHPSNADIVLVLDSSGSMSQLFFWGNDPWGKRKKAAKKLVDQLSPSDRIAVVDFDESAKVLFPLLSLSSPEVRARARDAIDRIDNSGGTSLNAGLSKGLEVLEATRGDGRDKHLLFLTDGQGEYTAAAFPADATEGIIIHTIGLGTEIDAALLTHIAETTGGSYYPVARASDLLDTFEKIFSEHILMTKTAENGGKGELLTPPWVPRLLRILSWGAMGLLIGLGQGVRENTREDLKACALGGFLGGLLGGTLFDPVSKMSGLAAGLIGRGLADVVVGAMIGGSMRLAQVQLSENRPTTTLTRVLPEKGHLVRAAPKPNPRPPARPATPIPVPPPPATRQRQSLSLFSDQESDTSLAMARAYHSGDYSLREISQHFGVSTSSVRRAANEHPGGDGAGQRLSKNT